MSANVHHILRPSTPALTNSRDWRPWRSRIVSALGKTVAAIFETGDLLIAAKAELPHGAWLKLVEKLPISARTCQRFMEIAADRRLRNATISSLLPPSWTTIYLLHQRSDDELEAGLKAKIIRPDMRAVDAKRLTAPIEGEILPPERPALPPRLDQHLDPKPPLEPDEIQQLGELRTAWINASPRVRDEYVLVAKRWARKRIIATVQPERDKKGVNSSAAERVIAVPKNFCARVSLAGAAILLGALVDDAVDAFHAHAVSREGMVRFLAECTRRVLLAAKKLELLDEVLMLLRPPADEHTAQASEPAADPTGAATSKE